MQPRGRSHPGTGYGAPRFPGTFLLAFREALAALNWQARRWMSDLVECTDEHGRAQVIGLENLYRRARPQPRAEWPALITEFLKTVHVAGAEELLPANLADVADKLLPRLGQPFRGVAEGVGVWSQPVAGTPLFVNLVIDYPNRMCYVTENLVVESGAPVNEWLERATANLLERTPPDCLQVIDEESGMRVCSVADAYDSSRAFLLETLLPEARPNGYFVAIPGRDRLLVQPVSLAAIPFVPLMKLIAEKDYGSAPYPICDQVFWIQNGTWYSFAVTVKGENATVQPPEEFLPILEKLGAGETDEPGTTSL